MKNLTTFRLQAALLGVVAVITMDARVAASEYVFPSNRLVPVAFRAIISTLRAKTSIPIFLPTKMSGAPDTTRGEIIEASNTSYTVQMSMGTSCHGAMYCRFGTLHGELISANTPSLSGKPIRFESGVIGYYTASVCAANCNESTLAFRYDGYQYAVGIEAGTLSDVLSTAKSLAQFGGSPQFGRLLNTAHPKTTHYQASSETTTRSNAARVRTTEK